MDTYMEERFEAAELFIDGELVLDPDYIQYSEKVNLLEDMLMECFGGEAARLMREYVVARFEVERFQNLHYFCQGYLAAKGS